MSQPGGKGRYKRRHYLIDAKFQVPIAAVMAVSGLAMVSYHLAIVRFLVANANAGRTLHDYNVLYVAPLLIVLMLAIVVLAVMVSHRVVGPAYRLIRTLESYGDGELEVRAHLRKHDGLKDVATSVNALGDALVDQRAARVALLTELKESLDGSEAPDAADIIARLEALEAGASDEAASDEAAE